MVAREARGESKFAIAIAFLSEVRHGKAANTGIRPGFANCLQRAQTVELGQGCSEAFGSLITPSSSASDKAACVHQYRMWKRKCGAAVLWLAPGLLFGYSGSGEMHKAGNAWGEAGFAE